MVSRTGESLIRTRLGYFNVLMSIVVSLVADIFQFSICPFSPFVSICSKRPLIFFSFSLNPSCSGRFSSPRIENFTSNVGQYSSHCKVPSVHTDCDNFTVENTHFTVTSAPTQSSTYRAQLTQSVMPSWTVLAVDAK